jgi:Protein of unknown function (DUF3501)
VTGHTSGARRLTVDDILDLRAYEREREEYRRRIIGLKRRRRVTVGPLVSLVFENRETIRSQVQEMARAERMASDEQIQTELDVYNPLIPEPGELSATMFIELTGEDALREWLPKLVGIERDVELVLGADEGAPANGHSAAEVVRSVPERAHEEALSREEITASVHYIRFELTPDQIERFARAPVTVAVGHPAYRHQTVLAAETREELLSDLMG